MLMLVLVRVLGPSLGVRVLCLTLRVPVRGRRNGRRGGAHGSRRRMEDADDGTRPRTSLQEDPGQRRRWVRDGPTFSFTGCRRASPSTQTELSTRAEPSAQTEHSPQT
ncbi:hypothetical protein FM105_12195 [Brevibacterium yomogidense]|uniref:Uncharacterized protein n=1 Tax=Brevibacterium yomogidense TaxID=946573 RepID=A0A1X6XL75_9MICO|nr:hypothetical protein FM105_12195 [Brevibacterium yomogidense]